MASFGLLAAGTLAFAQSSNSYVEQWHKAKFGRPTATAEARAKAEADSTAYRADPKAERKAKPASWTEERHKAKYGRNTPAEEARQREEAASTAYREDTSAKKEDPNSADARRREFFKAKYGRDLTGKQ
ncbi:MAG TPA: hypothetical protein DEH78_21555 [Solibacterales bacterium]|nr:hypothetical protein [Bryobacterales bacterium]